MAEADASPASSASLSTPASSTPDAGGGGGGGAAGSGGGAALAALLKARAEEKAREACAALPETVALRGWAQEYDEAVRRLQKQTWRLYCSLDDAAARAVLSHQLSLPYPHNLKHYGVRLLFTASSCERRLFTRRPAVNRRAAALHLPSPHRRPADKHGGHHCPAAAAARRPLQSRRSHCPPRMPRRGDVCDAPPPPAPAGPCRGGREAGGAALSPHLPHTCSDLPRRRSRTGSRTPPPRSSRGLLETPRRPPPAPLRMPRRGHRRRRRRRPRY